MFRYCVTKKFRRNILIIPSLITTNFCATGLFLKQSRDGFLYELSRHCETKKSLMENRDKPFFLLVPLIHKIFPNQIFYEAHKGSSTKVSGTLRQKTRRTLVLPVPLLCMKILDTRFFPKHTRVPLQSFSVLWDKTFQTENRDVPVLSIKCFDTRIFRKHRRVPQRSFSVLWDKLILTENLDTRPLFYP